MKYITDYYLEKYIIESHWDSFPFEIQNRAKMCLIDLLGALIIGSGGTQFQNGVRLVNKLGLVGDIPVIGVKEKYNLLGASIAYSHASNSFDIDDGFNLVKGHPGASFISGILAAAVEKNITIQELLCALVVCYEVAIRWGLSMQSYYNYLHSTGAYGAFGTAAGISKIYGLSEKQINNALSIADYHAPMTPVMRSVLYPSMNKDGVPFGSLVGTMAVLETVVGETAQKHILERQEYRGYLESLGKYYYIMDLYFKPYTCCRWAHQPVFACLLLKNKYGFSYSDIKHINVFTFDAAVKLNKEYPNNTDEAQYNIAFPIACSLVFGKVGYKQVNDNALDNKCIKEIMPKISFIVSAELESRFPEERLSQVKIELNDGRVIDSGVVSAPGEKDDNIDLYWIQNKFVDLTEGFLESDIKERIFDLILNHDNKKVVELIGFINHNIYKGEQ